MTNQEKLNEISAWYQQICQSVEKAFYGKRDVVEKILVALLSGGHVLLEDVPGVGKTILARAISASIGGTFRRVQCTPDLLPADIIGISIYNPGSSGFIFHEGPIFSHILLVDEINRATPRTQSALLEAMAESQVSVEGKRKNLPEPFFIIATENPVEFEGTFPLPEAQKDRFFLSCKIGYPTREVERTILESRNRTDHPVNDITPVTDMEKINEIKNFVVKVFVNQEISNYILNIVETTRQHPKISLGVSPRGSLALYRGSQSLALLRGRDYVVPEDVKDLVLPVLSKRIIMTPDCMMKGIVSENILSEILASVEVPVIKGGL